MNERITSVTAYTTLDFVDGAAVGHDWTEGGSGVLNVSVPDEAPDRVELQFELDGLDVDRLPNHADRIDLTAEQARTVAAALTRHADRIEDGDAG
ncbi:hypothetical protein C471_00465 [Halorubrum saccharovorum DSM 1137]|uniref:Uncharacterized protein n=1 Tax=Halorubrum saccharovorum DSM 1137 TaxID=1227484 RepID=M0E943_9EURY|nr:DUF6360 family protein [Halorubrum saccharovorum]ELZ43543.1 hypothetical protein C471_00465 [Halorubrum saccharovorum DSM 1137]